MHSSHVGPPRQPVRGSTLDIPGRALGWLAQWLLARSARHLILALVFLFCVIYVPDVGHGFLKDDFQWVIDARQPPAAAVTNTSGFFRPLVTLSFRADYELFGLDTYPYGLTNLALAAACAALVFALARSLDLGTGAAIFGAAVWAFNFHGINMGVLWLSGRTALLLTLFALLAAVAFIKGRKVLCLMWVTAALLSKEEAVLLPVALLLWRVILNDDTRLRPHWAGAIKDSWWLMTPLPLYAAVRLSTNAMMPSDAPDYYAFTFAPLAVARNFLEYLDRSWTFPVAGMIFLWGFARPVGGVDQRRYRVALCGLVWFACGLALTVFLPVRSSLYACFPSAGAALACAAVVDGWIARMTADRLRRAAVAAVLLLIALIPIYRLRNERWVEIADLSAETTATLEHCSKARCHSILLEDDLRTRRNFASTFGTFDSVAHLFLGREIPSSILPGPVESTRLADESCVLHIRLIDNTPRPELRGPCDH